MREEDLYEKELTFLRGELRDLKNCQVTFLTIAVSGTGLLLCFTANLSLKPFNPILRKQGTKNCW